MIDADVVIDVFNSCIDCLSSMLNTSVGAWIGGCIILLFILRFFKALQNI